jgi:hypothetical protein
MGCAQAALKRVSADMVTGAPSLSSPPLSTTTATARADVEALKLAAAAKVAAITRDVAAAAQRVATAATADAAAQALKYLQASEELLVEASNQYKEAQAKSTALSDAAVTERARLLQNVGDPLPKSGPCPPLEAKP